MSTGRQVDSENERAARLNETVTLTRRELRENAAANWDAGYDAHRRGEQRHNPYRDNQQAPSQPPGIDPQGAPERLLAWIKKATPAEVFAVSVRAGIHNPDGSLTEKYGGVTKGTPQKPEGET